MEKIPFGNKGALGGGLGGFERELLLMVRFRIKSLESDYWFWVYVHEDLKEMREAAYEHAKTTDEQNAYYDNAYGICHTYQRWIIPKDAPEYLYKNIGIIRLARKHCATEIVTHEITHAAMHLYRIANKRGKVASFGNFVNDREETLCYMVGQLFRQMNVKLYKSGIWS